MQGEIKVKVKNLNAEGAKTQSDLLAAQTFARPLGLSVDKK